jgi:hypothetical protein
MPMCLEKHVERGTPKGYPKTGLRTTRNGEKGTMARTVEEEVNELRQSYNTRVRRVKDPEGFDKGTYNRAVCGNCVSELAEKRRAGGAR